MFCVGEESKEEVYELLLRDLPFGNIFIVTVTRISVFRFRVGL